MLFVQLQNHQELANERKLRQLEKFQQKVQNSGFVKKESHLEKQIAKAEGCLDQLSEYEKVRLENMKERQALLEQLDIDQKKEIAEERQKSIIFTLKEEVGRRAPSPRVKALKEQKRELLEEQRKVQSQIPAQRVSPQWVGQWLPLRTNFGNSQQEEMMEVEDVGIECTVPSGMLKFGEIEEQGTRLHNSQASLECIAAELKELVEEPPYTIRGAIRTLEKPKHTPGLKDRGIFSKLEMENESVVSTSAITSMSTCWDFVGFGTAEGGVGVNIGATNISLMPHNGEVTGIAFCGGSSNLGILSTSLDGAVRRSDLARQSVLLEYKEDEEGIRCLAKRNQSEFLLGCDSTVRLLDLRRRRVDSFLRQGGSGIALHPTDPHMLAVGACIYDLRQSKSALLQLQGQVSSLQWSPISGEYLLAVGKVTKWHGMFGHQANVFSLEQLLRGEEGLLLTRAITEPLAAQWNPWCEASLLLSYLPIPSLR